MEFEIDDEMIKEFKEEAAELLEDAENGLMALVKGAEFQSNYNQIFRSFHSLKGGAGMFGLIEVQGHLHQIETQFESLNGEGSITESQIDYFLNSIDVAKSLFLGSKVDFNYDEFGNETRASSPVEVIEKKIEKKIEEKSKKNKKILIYVVDDEVEILDIYVQFFKEKDEFEIKTFENPKEILDEINIKMPNLIISDYKMPEMSGIELLQKIRKVDRDIPLIFVSAFLDYKTMSEALSFGAFDFISKPMDINIVFKTCRNAFHKYQLLKLLNRSINHILYQFSDLDEFLKESGKEDLRKALKYELEQIIEQKHELYKNQPM